jgi:hypothetical protein
MQNPRVKCVIVIFNVQSRVHMKSGYQSTPRLYIRYKRGNVTKCQLLPPHSEKENRYSDNILCTVVIAEIRHLTVLTNYWNELAATITVIIFEHI